MMTAPPLTTPTDADLAQLRQIVGPAGVIEGADQAPLLSEGRRRWHGSAAMVLAPDSTQQVAEILRFCNDRHIAITPQGGNTGLVGGQIPTGTEILLSLRRLRKVREVSALNNTMTLDAGVLLAEAQEAATAADRLFPLSIGSEGSCQIGGIVSTNAGGVNVLRYGNMRDLVLGLEVVTPSGDIWDGLRRLRKDNTGYDLKQLYIGSEGTLGVVTGAVVKLFARPTQTITAIAGLANIDQAIALLARGQAATGGQTTSFELIARACLDAALTHIPGTRDPFNDMHPWYVLMEFSSGDSGDLHTGVERFLAGALEQELASDVVLAQHESQRRSLWHMRHSLSEALSGEARGIRLDVSVSTVDVPSFIEDANEAIRQIVPDVRFAPFGHLGDGNIHYDILPKKGDASDALEPHRDTIENAVFDIIDRYDGSIAAEHGIGIHKRDAMAARKSSISIGLMHAVKAALDPNGIMNPGKVLKTD